MNSLIIFGLIAVVLVLYTVRVLTRGRAHYQRIEDQGSSSLLGKGPMEMVYWSLQPVAKLLIFFKITPNFISWMSLVFGLLAGAALAFGHFGFGAAFASVSALLDSLDGLVARMTEVSSDAGEVLDATIDRYVEFAFFVGLIVYYREIPVLVVITLMAMVGSFMVSYSTAKAEALRVIPPRGNMRRTERALYLTFGALLSPVTIPWFEPSNMYGLSIGYPMVVALGLVAVLSNVSAIERLVVIAREMRNREDQEKKHGNARKSVGSTSSCDESVGSDSGEAKYSIKL